jgi:hypothetical protein
VLQCQYKIFDSVANGRRGKCYIQSLETEEGEISEKRAEGTHRGLLQKTVWKGG